MSIPSASRLPSSSTFNIRKRRPSAPLSCTKSIDHRRLGAVGDGTVTRGRHPLPPLPAHGEPLPAIQPPHPLVIDAHAFLLQPPVEHGPAPAGMRTGELAEPLAEGLIADRPLRGVAQAAAADAQPAAGPSFALGGRGYLRHDDAPLGHRHHSFPSTSLSTCRLSA